MLAILDPILIPLARLLVRGNVPFNALSERFKGHMVRAALREGARTDSQISVMTGLQRRDIARLRGQEQAVAPVPNAPARLVAQWGIKIDHFGWAATLPRTGPTASFEVLALEARGDLHPRTLLDLLLAAGTVQLDSDDRVTLMMRSYQPTPGSDAQLAYLSGQLGDHAAAGVANVLTNPPPFFDRSVHYAHLSAADIASLQALYQTRQMAVLEEVSAKAASLQQATPPDQQDLRFRAGGYFYAQTEKAPPP